MEMEGDPNWEKKIVDFYTEHNPSKVSHVSALLKRFEGQEAELWDALRDKYQSAMKQDDETELHSPARVRVRSKPGLSDHFITTVSRATLDHPLGLTFSGTMITAVEPGSPADSAGLAPEMTILTIDSVPLEGNAVGEAIASAGETFTLSVRRATRPKTPEAGRIKMTVASQNKEKQTAKEDTTWAQRDFWPPPEPKFVAKKGWKSMSPSPGRKGYSATPKRGSESASPEPHAHEAPAAQTSAQTPETLTPRSRFKAQRKPSVPVLSGMKSNERQQSQPRDAMAELHTASNIRCKDSEQINTGNWVSVMTPGLRGPLTATEKFELSLQEKGERRRSVNEHTRKIKAEEEKLLHIEERILREDAERAKRLESKIAEWEDLMAKKEHVRKQRMRLS